jgi:hypothetical protein
MTFGPWSATCEPEERGKQLRSLACLAAAYLGSSHRLVAELRRAESDPVAFVRAAELVDRLPSLHRRRLLSTFARVTFGERS